MTVYVYHDEDTGTLYVRDSLDKAKVCGYAEEDEIWETEDKNTWSRGEYEHIYKKEVL